MANGPIDAPADRSAALMLLATLALGLQVWKAFAA
jgi:hypothetical protein